MKTLTTPITPVTWAVIAFVGIIVITMIGLIYYITTIRSLPSPINLAALVNTATKNAAIYPKQMPNRKGLQDYLQSIGNLPADVLSLSNFYVMTANLGGFFSPVNNAAFCPEAIQYALNAGARGLIFDVWSNTAKGANMGPILQVRANDASLQLLSPYSLDLVTALQTVQKYGFGDSANPANNDPLFLFFRFRGNPTINTLNGTANAISIALEQYRLPTIYSSTNSNPLYSTPIDAFQNKIIILSNYTGYINGQRTRFADYVNNASTTNNKNDLAIRTSGDVYALGDADLVKLQTNTAQNNILTCAPLPEDTANSESNAWDWSGAMNAGIQLCGINLWAMDAGLNKYTDPSMFGVYSFLIKPENSSDKSPVGLRHQIEHIPPPISVKNPGYGDGTVVVK
jgi:hypothetical protein